MKILRLMIADFLVIWRWLMANWRDGVDYLSSVGVFGFGAGAIACLAFSPALIYWTFTGWSAWAVVANVACFAVVIWIVSLYERSKKAR